MKKIASVYIHSAIMQIAEVIMALLKHNRILFSFFATIISIAKVLNDFCMYYFSIIYCNTTISSSTSVSPSMKFSFCDYQIADRAFFKGWCQGFSLPCICHEDVGVCSY
jgi:hypothetical protein